MFIYVRTMTVDFPTGQTKDHNLILKHAKRCVGIEMHLKTEEIQ